MYPWWRHDVQQYPHYWSLCEGNPLVTGGFPNKGPVIWDLILSLLLSWTKLLNSHSNWRCVKTPWYSWGISVIGVWSWRCKPKFSTRTKVVFCIYTWWSHQMETFSALLALCVANSPVTGEFPSQRASGAELWCFLWSAHEKTVE